MSYTLRRVPGAAEVDVLDAKVGGNQKLVPCRNFQDRAIVADAPHHGPIPACGGDSPDPSDQLSFFAWQLESNYSEKAMVLGRQPRRD